MLDKKQTITKGFILDHLPINSVGLEIGVWKGEFSEVILDKLSPKLFYMVDPWKYMENYSDRWYGGTWATSQKDMDNIFEEICLKFKNQPVKIIRDFSDNLLNHIPEETLDWVYIDGNHDYEFVLNDLTISKKLLKHNGLIVGDDYIRGNDIHTALDTFTSNFKLEYKTIENQFIIQLR